MAFDFNSKEPAEGGFDNAWKKDYAQMNEPIAKAQVLEVIILAVEGVIRPNSQGVVRERLQVTVGTRQKKRFKVTIYGNKYNDQGQPVEGTYTKPYWDFMQLAAMQIDGNSINSGIREVSSQYDQFRHLMYNAFEGAGVRMAIAVADRGLYNGYYAYTGRFVQADTHLSAGEVRSGATQPQAVQKYLEYAQKDHDGAKSANGSVSAPAYGSMNTAAPAPAPKPAPVSKPKGQTVAIDPLNDDIPF